MTAAIARHRTTHQLSLAVFILMLCSYLLTAGGHLYARDGVSMFLMTSNFSRSGSLAIEPGPNTMGGTFSRDGRYYSPFSFGQPVLAVPLFLAGSLVTERTSYRYASSFAVSLFNSFVSAASVAVLCSLLILLGYPRRVAISVALIAGFCSITWPYARFFFAEPLVTLCQLTAIYLIYQAERDGRWTMLTLFAAGFAAGWAIVTRPVAVIALPSFMLLTLLLWRLRRPGDIASRMFFFLLPTLMAIMAIAATNYFRFGDALNLGHGPLPTGQPQGFTFPLLTGLHVLLFSPGKSILLFSPVILLTVPFWKRFFSNQLPLAVAVGTMALVNLLFFSQWCQVEGGYTWGPRFLVPLVPLLLLPLAEMLTSPHRSGQRWPWRLLVISIIVFSVGIQLLGILVNYTEVIEQDSSKYYDRGTGRYSVDFSPLPRHVALLRDIVSGHHEVSETIRPPRERRKELLVINLAWTGRPDLWFLHLLDDGVPVLPILTIIVLLIGGIAWSARRLRRLSLERESE